MLHGPILMKYIIWMQKKKPLKHFLNFESEHELGMSYLSKPLCEIFNLEDVSFQLQKLGTIQMHMLQSIETNERLEHLQLNDEEEMPSWGRNANGLYYKHLCMLYSCIYMQGYLHDGKHLCVCNYNFEP